MDLPIELVVTLVIGIMVFAVLGIFFNQYRADILATIIGWLP